MAGRYVAAFSISVVLLTGCGTPGAPQPPSLRLPRPVEDLEAIRRGDKVHLSWTAPVETTDGDAIRGQARTRVCRSFRAEPQGKCRDLVIELPYMAQVDKPMRQNHTDDLSALLPSARQNFVLYSLEVANADGRIAGPSNPQTIFLARSVPPPPAATATLQPDAILLEWNGAELPPAETIPAKYRYRVLRSGETPGEQETKPPAVVAGEIDANARKLSFRDTNFDWEQKYTYQIVGVTEVLSLSGDVLASFEGERSAQVEVIATDKFPPAAPEGLQAVYAGTVDPGQNFIDLTWTPGIEADLAGYNIYRSTAAAAPQRINTQIVNTPAFRDEAVERGNRYTYSVTSLDARGNESPPSLSTTEEAPR